MVKARARIRRERAKAKERRARAKEKENKRERAREIANPFTAMPAGYVGNLGTGEMSVLAVLDKWRKLEEIAEDRDLSSAAASLGAASTAAGSSRMSNTSTQGRSVRQVEMYVVGTPPNIFPEEFELASDDGSQSWYVRAVREMGPEYFWIGDEEEDAEQWNRDGFY